MGEKFRSKREGFDWQFFSNLLTSWARNEKVAGGWTMSGSWFWYSMNRSLKDDLTFMGRLLMMFWIRVWVRATLWRFSTSWNCLMISKLACRVLILGDRSSVTSCMDS